MGTPSTVDDTYDHTVVPAPKPQVLAAVADAQPVDFSPMATQQQSCPEVVEMLTSSNLQITSQTVGRVYLLGDVSTFQDRSGRGHHYGEIWPRSSPCQESNPASSVGESALAKSYSNNFLIAIGNIYTIPRQYFHLTFSAMSCSSPIPILWWRTIPAWRKKHRRRLNGYVVTKYVKTGINWKNGGWCWLLFPSLPLTQELSMVHFSNYSTNTFNICRFLTTWPLFSHPRLFPSYTYPSLGKRPSIPLSFYPSIPLSLFPISPLPPIPISLLYPPPPISHTPPGPYVRNGLYATSIYIRLQVCKKYAALPMVMEYCRNSFGIQTK